jgi:hypothetical protein
MAIDRDAGLITVIERVVEDYLELPAIGLNFTLYGYQTRYFATWK